MNPEIKKLPSTVYGLQSEISSLTRLSPDHQLGLSRLGIHTILDLLRHYPSRYANMEGISGAANLVKGQSISLYGIMEKVSVRRSFKGHVPMTEARVVDNTGHIRCIWCRN
jgi:ATP-dependent DNA helicase RecG